jgi:spermidine/putrescine transport system permease protein
LVIYAAMAPLGAGLLEAAQDLGAGSRTLWRRVIIPIMAAPAASAFLFVFILSASDYVTPQFLGGTQGLTLGVQVQVNFRTLGNYPVAAATSFLMMAAFLATYLLTSLVLRFLRLHDIRFVN